MMSLAGRLEPKTLCSHSPLFTLSLPNPTCHWYIHIHLPGEQSSEESQLQRNESNSTKHSGKLRILMRNLSIISQFVEELSCRVWSWHRPNTCIHSFPKKHFTTVCFSGISGMKVEQAKYRVENEGLSVYHTLAYTCYMMTLDKMSEITHARHTHIRISRKWILSSSKASQIKPERQLLS